MEPLIIREPLEVDLPRLRAEVEGLAEILRDPHPARASWCRYFAAQLRSILARVVVNPLPEE
jgi:hypothetical protein